MMNISAGKSIGFAENSLCQRRRCVESVSEKQLNIEIQEIEKTWDEDCRDAGIVNGINKEKSLYEGSTNWKNEVLKKITKYPSLPAPLKKVHYQTRFIQLQIEDTREDIVYLDDYHYFLNSMKYSSHYRLDNRLLKKMSYPVDKPVFPGFPVFLGGIPLREIPKKPQKPIFIPPKFKWYHFILFWGYFISVSKYRKDVKSRTKTFERKLSDYEEKKANNEWRRQLNADRHLYWKHQKEKFEAACDEITNKWEQDKTDFEKAISQDRERARDLNLKYEDGSSNGVCNYFKEHLNSIPLPKWTQREYGIKFDEKKGVLLIDLRLPYLKNTQIYKTKRLEAGNKLVPATEKEDSLIKSQFLYLMVLGFMWEISHLDYKNRINMICCNGFVIYDDPVTGNKRRDVIMSITTKKDELRNILLDRIDPKSCFHELKGVRNDVVGT